MDTDSSNRSHFTGKATVFLIEDDPTDSYLTRMALERTANLPLLVVGADTGERALERLRHHCRHYHCPQLVLLDLSLPDCSGEEVLSTVRADSLLQDLPVVILTGSDDPEARQRALELGANDYWLKPSGLLGYMDIMRRVKDYLTPSVRQ